MRIPLLNTTFSLDVLQHLRPPRAPLPSHARGAEAADAQDTAPPRTDVLLLPGVPDAVATALAARHVVHRAPELPGGVAARIAAVVAGRGDAVDASLITGLRGLRLVALCGPDGRGVDLHAALKHGVRVAVAPVARDEDDARRAALVLANIDALLRAAPLPSALL